METKICKLFWYLWIFQVSNFQELIHNDDTQKHKHKDILSKLAFQFFFLLEEADCSFEKIISFCTWQSLSTQIQLRHWVVTFFRCRRLLLNWKLHISVFDVDWKTIKLYCQRECFQVSYCSQKCQSTNSAQMDKLSF